MIPCDPPRPPVKPHSPRYVVVDLGEKHGAHPLRGPTFAGDDLLGRLAEDAKASWEAPEGTPARLRQMSPMMGAAVGAMWWHQELSLEAERPAWTAPTTAWLQYGEAVCDELVEQGYSLLNLADLYLGAMQLVNRGLGVVQEAGERADFSSAPGETPSPEAPTPAAK